MNIYFLILVMTCAVIQTSASHSNKKQITKPNYIDSIQTADQIEQLIFNINSKYKGVYGRPGFKVNTTMKFSNESCQQLSDSLQTIPWAKADFDNNGRTDILVAGNWYEPSILCILDKGNDKYEIKEIIKESFLGCASTIVTSDKHSARILFYYHTYGQHSGEPPKVATKSLLYKYGDFIEENKRPNYHTIQKIDYSTDGCFGYCPIFNLTITSDRKAIWYADRYNKINNTEVFGRFTSTLTKDNFFEISNLLNYIDFENLKDNYTVNSEDESRCTLKITYDNGKTKLIKDYGLIGTFGLSRVYQVLHDLRKNQQWTDYK